MAQPGRKLVTFGLDAPRGGDFGVLGNQLVRGRTALIEMVGER